MDNVVYKVLTGNPASYSEESYSSSDLALLNTFPINTQYSIDEHFIEVHVYNIAGNRLRSVYNYGNEKQLLGSESAGTQGASNLYIDPVADAIELGYDKGGVNLVYHFLKLIATNPLFISDISSDRLELKTKFIQADTTGLEAISEFINRLQSTSYLIDFRLNFLQDDLLIGVNLELSDEDTILFKLYEPLPETFSIKSQFALVEVIADTISYEISAETLQSAPSYPYLKGPNFNIELREENVIPTEYLDYTELFNYPVTSSYNQLLSQTSNIGIDINVDYTAFENFVHFSSAKERIDNFVYKVGLIEFYESSSLSLSNTLSSTAQTSVTQSTTYYNTQISNIIQKFDGFEKYLYFESSSYTYPKLNSEKPYINAPTGSTATLTWYDSTIASASLYDELNENNLVYTVPEFIRQDSSNAPYSLFLNMIGQHFDNLWIYTKAVTDKYNGDNRLDVGISRDLIRDVLKSFGVKLYSSNFSVSNLASALLGEWYDSGSESISTFVTASNLPTPDRDIVQETYKRIYHNLPYLIKTKGTDRGLRALINCFGIPSGSLQIREYGGVSRANLPYFGPATETFEKVRLDHTGSVIPGDTLSQYVSSNKPEYQYTQDNHILEVGFSPTYYIDDYISANITGSFHIDQYIGDPRSTFDRKYYDLQPFISSSIGGLDRYDVYDFVRLIKFYDNQLAKMVKDFVPARATATTGIIIKPHILERNKYAQPIPTGIRPEYSASIDTAFITGSAAGALNDLDTSYTSTILQKAGYVTEVENTQVERINGELSGSIILATTGELNDENPFKNPLQPECTYTVIQYLDGDGGINYLNYIYGYPISSGNISIFWGTAFGGGNYVQAMKVHFTPGTGDFSFENSFRAGVTSITIGSSTYYPSSISVGTGAAVLRFDEPKVPQISLNPAAFPLTTTESVLILPYVVGRFDNSDYNALMNNASAIANSARLQKVDFTSGAIVATNIEALRNNTADISQTQEYLHNSIGMTSGRYIGKQLYASALNEFDPATDKSYGISPVVEQTVPYFGTFNQIYATPDIYNAIELSVPYVTFQNGDLIQTGTSSDIKYDMKNIFTEDKYASVLVKTSPSGSNRFSKVNKEYRIKKGGKRLETILNTQSGSLSTSGKFIKGGPQDRFDFIFFGEDTGVAEYRMHGYFSGSVDRADQLINATTTNVAYETKAPAGSSADWDGSVNAYSLDVQAETPVVYKSEVLLEFDRDGTGWGNDLSVDVILERYDGSLWNTVQTKTVVPSWNRYRLDWTQPDGIDIIGYYKESTGILKVFVKVTLNSGGLSGFGDPTNPEKLRTRIVNNTSVNDDVFLLNYVKGSYNSVNDKYTVEFRNRGRTADLGGEIRVVFGPNYQTYPFDLRTKFEVTQDVLPQKVVAFDNDPNYPPFAPAINHPTASISLGTTLTSNQASSPYLWVSSSIGDVLGMVQNTDEAETLGFREITTPLSFQIGDEIRMAGREEAVFTIVDIWTKSDPRLAADSLLLDRADKELVLKVEPPVPYGTFNFNILIRRYVDDPTKVILYENKPTSYDEFGLITPKYITSQLEENYEEYSNKAFTQIQ